MLEVSADHVLLCRALAAGVNPSNAVQLLSSEAKGAKIFEKYLNAAMLVLIR